MTSGGPNDSTNVIVYSIYKYAFEYFDIGKACALAYILFVVIFILAILQRKLKKEVEKQQEEITSLKIEIKKRNKKIREKNLIIGWLIDKG